MGICSFVDKKISSLGQKYLGGLCYSKAMSSFRGLSLLAVAVTFLIPQFSFAQFEYIPVAAPETPSGEVDLVVESNTIKPTFYAGREELIPGSQIKIVAIPSSNQFFNSDSLSYHWEVDGKTQASKGSVLNTTVPNSRQLNISVIVRDQNNHLFAQSAKSIAVSSPFLVFYEDNPLRGTADVSFGNSISLIGEEVSVRAVPFFMDNKLGNSLTTGWRVDRTEVVNENSDPYVITLQSVEGGRSDYQVNFDVFNRNNPLQRALGEFKFINQYE